jgi:uncharacterized OB-fold protein
VRVLDIADPEAAHARNRPLPVVDNDSAPYWAGVAEGRLRLQRCDACAEHQFYPRALCVRCAGPVGWVDAAGEGVVYTYTVVRQNLAPPFEGLGPYVVAMVELPEGPRLMGNVTHVDPDDVRIGLPVTAYAVRIRDDLGLPFWRPATTPTEGEDQ